MNWQSQYSMTQGQMRIYNTNKKPLESLHRFEGLQVLKTSMFYFPSFFWRSISVNQGISMRHGPHQVAQKSRRTTLPR